MRAQFTRGQPPSAPLRRLAVQVTEDAATPRPFFLFDRAAAGSTPLPVREALDALDALELFRPPGSCAFYHHSGPLWTLRDGRTGRPRVDVRPGPGLLLALDASGARLLVGEADWPAGADPTHRALWRTFTPPEKADFSRRWRELERGWHYRGVGP